MTVVGLTIVLVAVTASDIQAGPRCADRAYLYDRGPEPCQVDGYLRPNYEEYGFFGVHWKHWPTEPPPKEETTVAPAAPTDLPGWELPNPEEEGLRQPAKPKMSKESPDEESATDADASPPPPPELGDRPPAPTLPGSADGIVGPPSKAPLEERSSPRPELPKIERPPTPELPNPKESFDEFFPSPLSPDKKPSEPTENDTSTSVDPTQSRLSSESKTVRDDRPPSPAGRLADHYRASPLRSTTLRRGGGRSVVSREGSDLAQNSRCRTSNPLRIADKGSPSVIRTVSHEEVLDNAPPPADTPPILADDRQENPLRRN